MEVCALGVLLVDLMFQAPFTEMQQFEKEILTLGSTFYRSRRRHLQTQLELDSLCIRRANHKD